MPADYASETTDFLVAVAQASFTPTSSGFTLLAEVDFGPNYGIRPLYIRSRTNPTASGGLVRMNANDYVAYRNTANTDDIRLGINAQDFLQYRDQILRSLTVAELDGTVSGNNIYKLLVPTGSLINNGDGTVFLDAGSGVDTTQFILVDGTRPFTGDQSLGGNDLTNVGSITSVTGTFTSGLTVGGSTTYIYPNEIRTGTITLSGAVTNSNQATTKSYVDTAVSTATPNIPAIVGGQYTTVVTGTNSITVASAPPSAPAIIAGSNVSVVSGTNTITVSSSAGGSSHAIVGDSFIGVVSGTNTIRLSADAIIGTANQITVTSGSNTVTVSLPSSVSGLTSIQATTVTGTTGQFAGTVSARRGEFSQGLTVSGIPVPLTGGAGSGDFLKDGSVAMTGAFRATDGTVAAPSITFANETDVGVYRAGTNSLGFAVDGDRAVTITGGAGETNPEAFRFVRGAAGVTAEFSNRNTTDTGYEALAISANSLGLLDSESSSFMSIDDDIQLFANANLLLSAGGFAGEASVTATSTVTVESNSGDLQLFADSVNASVILTADGSGGLVNLSAGGTNGFIGMAAVGSGGNASIETTSSITLTSATVSGSNYRTGGSVTAQTVAASTSMTVSGQPVAVAANTWAPCGYTLLGAPAASFSAPVTGSYEMMRFNCYLVHGGAPSSANEINFLGFNNDKGANYMARYLFNSSGGSAISSSGIQISSGNMASSAIGAGMFNGEIFQLPQTQRQLTLHGGSLAVSGTAAIETVSVYGQWTNPNAVISSIQIFPSAQPMTYQAGSWLFIEGRNRQ